MKEMNQKTVTIKDLSKDNFIEEETEVEVETKEKTEKKTKDNQK